MLLDNLKQTMKFCLKKQRFTTTDMLPRQRFRLFQAGKSLTGQLMVQKAHLTLDIKKTVRAIQITTITENPGYSRKEK
jgi:hypothetical protein